MADKQQYVSIEDAAERLGVTRPSIHYYIRALGLTKYRFKLDKNAYLSKEDFERVKQLKEEAAERSEPLAV